jgi:carboxymethylenebutenolidase
MSEERVDIRTTDGVLDCHVFNPDGRGPWPGVLIYMDAFGIRPELASMAQRLASDGYTVALPNLYFRSGAFPPFNPSEVIVEGPERDRFKGMIASITDTMVMADTASVIDALDSLPVVRAGPMGVVGYCMGGGFALGAAGTFPARIAAAASFHGGSLATDKPDSPHRRAAGIRGRVYIGVAAIDPTFTQEQEQRLRKALDDGGVDYLMETYEGAKHGFAVTGHRVYDRDASERHWQVLLRLFRDTLPRQ